MARTATKMRRKSRVQATWQTSASTGEEGYDEEENGATHRGVRITGAGDRGVGGSNLQWMSWSTEGRGRSDRVPWAQNRASRGRNLDPTCL